MIRKLFVKGINRKIDSLLDKNFDLISQKVALRVENERLERSLLFANASADELSATNKQLHHDLAEVQTLAAVWKRAAKEHRLASKKWLTAFNNAFCRAESSARYAAAQRQRAEAAEARLVEPIPCPDCDSPMRGRIYNEGTADDWLSRTTGILQPRNNIYTCTSCGVKLLRQVSVNIQKAEVNDG